MHVYKGSNSNEKPIGTAKLPMRYVHAICDNNNYFQCQINKLM